jgi:DNA-binding transcriptional MerR regulator
VRNQGWKVGELAKRVGLTVRTLHHYDQIGLFSPSQTTESGHRIYSEADVRTFQQIMSLKQLGFALEAIRDMINNPAYDPVAILSLQLSRLDEQIDTLRTLRDRVQAIRDQVQVGQPVSSELFLAVIQMMNLMQSPHFNPEQIDRIKGRYLSLTADVRDQLAANGQQYLSEFRRYLDLGKAPTDPDVVTLARRWKDEMAAFLPADEQLTKSAERYYQENPHAGLALGMDGELYNYIKQATSLV